MKITHIQNTGQWFNVRFENGQQITVGYSTGTGPDGKIMVLEAMGCELQHHNEEEDGPLSEYMKVER